MSLHSYTVSHRDCTLDDVAKAATSAKTIETELAANTDVLGIVVLSTCNRVEIYLDTTDTFTMPPTIAHTLTTWQHHSDDDTLHHLFTVAAGLDSMVVGEREIMGQVRRAYDRARERGQVNCTLGRCFEAALSTSHKVAGLTGLESMGRSVVSVALDMAEDSVVMPGATALVVGTGSYAGATVAALRARGISDIVSYSVSDRGPAFAERHNIRSVDTDGFRDALATVALVVTCRGHDPVVTVADVNAAMSQRTSPLTIVDMALTRDVEEGVGDIDDVRLIDLAHVQAAVPELEHEQLAIARELVNKGIASLQRRLRGMGADPLVMQLRKHFARAVEKEAARLPAEGDIPVEVAVQALQRLANRIAHVPTVNAKNAATLGKTDEWADAFGNVFGELDTQECVL